MASDRASISMHTLEVAKVQFKFAIGLTSYCALHGPITGHIQAFSWGGQALNRGELALSRKREQLAASVFEHCALNILMQQLDTELTHKHGRRRLTTPDRALRAASWIARHVRNAFAHDPLVPVWQVDRSVRDEVFEWSGIARLDTRGLSGKIVQRRDYGGPIAVLRLSQKCREHYL